MRSKLLIEKLSTMFAANSRDEHVTMLTLHLPLAVFCFSEGLREHQQQELFELFSSMYSFLSRKHNHKSHICHKRGACKSLY